MYLPLFLCLYGSFWKGFDSDKRRLTLLVIRWAIFKTRNGEWGNGNGERGTGNGESLKAGIF